jgi:hypothetical protein
MEFLISLTLSGAQNLEVAPRFLENLWAYDRLVNELIYVFVVMHSKLVSVSVTDLV